MRLEIAEKMIRKSAATRDSGSVGEGPQVLMRKECESSETR